MAIGNSDSISMAVFCDFENVALGVRDAQYEQFDIRPVLERLLVKGSIVVKKAYCDWERYKGFKNAMHEANFELIEIPHVRQSGKNSADIRLVVDALDLCYTKSHVDTFVIVSGDSDFSPLVSKLRENAKQVIGVGVKQSTSDLLIANCDEFIFYDDLVREQARRSGRQSGRDSSQAKRGAGQDDARPRREDLETRRAQALEIAMETYDALSSERGDGSKLWASVLKDAIKRRRPDFNESYYGFRAFGNLLEEAQARGLLRVGRDERSGTYIWRDSAVTAPDISAQVTEAAPTAPRKTTSDGQEAGKRRSEKRHASKPPRHRNATLPTESGNDPIPATKTLTAPQPAINATVEPSSTPDMAPADSLASTAPSTGHATLGKIKSNGSAPSTESFPATSSAASAPGPGLPSEQEPEKVRKTARQPGKRSKPAKQPAPTVDANDQAAAAAGTKSVPASSPALETVADPSAMPAEASVPAKRKSPRRQSKPKSDVTPS